MSFDDNRAQNTTLRDVSIPLEQGNVFRLLLYLLLNLVFKGLNPFGTGQCLSTYQFKQLKILLKVSIPLEQGNVFRPLLTTIAIGAKVSQSLWNRAMSFDKTKF